MRIVQQMYTAMINDDLDILVECNSWVQGMNHVLLAMRQVSNATLGMVSVSALQRPSRPRSKFDSNPTIIPRLSVKNYRPAPVVVSFLAFPGTSGAVNMPPLSLAL